MTPTYQELADRNRALEIALRNIDAMARKRPEPARYWDFVRRICDSVGVGPSVLRVTGTMTTLTGTGGSTFVALPAPEKFTSGLLVRNVTPGQEDE